MTDLTDLEIVTACARAVGHTMTRDAFGPWKHDEDGRPTYNPLHDHAQAMELVKKLGLALYKGANEWRVADGENVLILDANLLRAICLCAARVQLEREKQRG